MRGWILAAVPVVLWVCEAAAEPYIAVREGYRCSACHVNRTGGGKRTDFAVTHARDLLHYPSFEALKPLTSPVEAFDGTLNKYVAIGADLRVDATATFQQRGNDGNVKNNVAFRGRLDELEIEVDEAVGYLEVRLIPDRLLFYLDQQLAPNTDTREAWGLLQLPWEVYLKAGKMFLPYGLQLQDDDAYIRGGRNGSANTGFSFEQQQAAFEIGWQPEPVEAIFAVSDGASGDKSVQVTGTVYSLLTDIPVVRNFLLGVSGSRVDSDYGLFGFFVGHSVGRFTYLGEVDFLFVDDSSTGDEERGVFVHYSEGDYLLFDWLNLKVAFNYADSDGDLSQPANDSENFITFGLEPFLARFLQLRLLYQVANGVESDPSHNQNVLTAEAHVFF
jgi:hypothetical protein